MKASCAGSPVCSRISGGYKHAGGGCPLPPRLLVRRDPGVASSDGGRQGLPLARGGEGVRWATELAVGPRAVASAQDRCGISHQRPTVTRRATAARPPNCAAVVCGTQRAVKPRPSPPPSPPHSNGRGDGLLSRPFANRRRPGGMASVARHPRGPCWGGAWRPRALPAACPDLALCWWDYGNLAVARVRGAGGGRSSSGAPGGGGARPLVTCSRSPSWLAGTGGPANAGNGRPRSGPGTGSCWWGDLHSPLTQPAVRSRWLPPPTPRAPHRLVLLSTQVAVRFLPAAWSTSPAGQTTPGARVRRGEWRARDVFSGGAWLVGWGVSLSRARGFEEGGERGCLPPPSSVGVRRRTWVPCQRPPRAGPRRLGRGGRHHAGGGALDLWGGWG